jgi:hypothetical protein
VTFPALGLQCSLGESFKRVRKNKEEAAAAAVVDEKDKRCDVPIIQPRPAETLLAGLQHARLESFEHEIDIKKSSFLSSAFKENQEPRSGGVDTSGSTLSELGPSLLHRESL